MRAFYVTDGCHFPPRGVRGGGDAAPSLPYVIHTDGEIEDLPTIANHDVQAGELLLHLLSGGGGYGDPLEREVERVRDDVLSQFIYLRTGQGCVRGGVYGHRVDGRADGG